MSAIAGYNSKVSVPGTPVTLTGEACSNVSGFTYQVTNAAKRFLNPAVAVVWKDGGVAITQLTNPYTQDGVYGRVTFQNAPGGAITVDASYLPMLEVATAKAFSIGVTTDLVEVTPFKTTTEKQRIPTLNDADFTLDTWDASKTDYDPGAGVVSLMSMVQAGLPLGVEFQLGLGTVTVRMLALMDKDSVKAAVAGAIDSSVSGKSTDVAGGGFGPSFLHNLPIAPAP